MGRIEYRKTHLAAYAQYQRNARAVHPRRNLLLLAKARAKSKGLPFSLQETDVQWVTHCPIFGMALDYNTTPPGQRLHAKRDAFATLDRRVPELGYIRGNVFVLSYKANRLKAEMTGAQAQRILAYIDGNLTEGIQ